MANEGFSLAENDFSDFEVEDEDEDEYFTESRKTIVGSDYSMKLDARVSSYKRPFVYEPLDLVQPSFRLVRLIRGREGPVECELFHAHLLDADNSIDYEALSYTWGGTTKPLRISLNRSDFAVTENLFEALNNMRDSDEDRILWIDAVCINQEDPKERGHQVQQMASIYECARQVIIWLGTATPATNALFNMIQVLERQALNHACNDWRPSDRRWQFLWSTVTMDMLKKEDDLPAASRCYAHMLERDWFKRVWVLQEVAKARAAKITCGTKSVSARFFALMPPLLGIRPDYHSQSVLDIMPGPARRFSWWTQERDLYTLLRRFRGSQASDPRDRIYALLGISSDVSEAHPFSPDYDKSEEEVVQNTMAFLVGLQSNNPRGYKLPQWNMTEFEHYLQTLQAGHLPWLSQQGHDVLVDLFLEKYPDSQASWVEYVDYYGRTALSWAAMNDRSRRVESLLKAGADANVKDWLGQTPLSLAAENGHVGVVEKLLDFHKVCITKIDLNTTDWRGRTPLAWAAGRGHETVVKKLLGTPGVDKTPSDRSGWTPMYLAIENGHHTIARLFTHVPCLSGTELEDEGRQSDRHLYLSGFRASAAGQPYSPYQY